jgi:hypothetical protein
MDEELTKHKIMDSIRVEHKLLEDQLEGLTEEQMLQTTLEGGWSIKDILAHIVSWERLMVQWSDTTLQGKIPEMLPPGMTWDDLDIWNEQLYNDNKATPLAEVMSNFHSSFKFAVEIVEKFSEEDLINPDRFEWREGRPFSDIVAANTYSHYKEHREQINLWRNNLGD